MTDDVDVVLREHARRWLETEPTPPALEPMVNAPRRSGRTRWLVAATVLVTLVVALTVGLLARHDDATAPPANPYPLTPRQRELALRIAHSEAITSNRYAGPHEQLRAGEWPDWVASVSATIVPRARAMSLVGSTGAGPNVLVIRLVGRFVVPTKGPQNTDDAHGNVITAVVSLHLRRITDFGVGQQRPPRGLPHATVLYQRAK